MSSDTERKATAPQFSAFTNQGFAQPAVYYFPSQIPVQIPSVNSLNGDEALARALQAEEDSLHAAPAAPQQQTGACKWKSFLCRRGYNRLDSSNGGCCMKDDGRPLGDLTSFIYGLFFGMIAPVFSVMAAYGFESKRLSRTGVLLGNANFFLILAILILSGGHQFSGMHGRPSHPPFGGNGTDILPLTFTPNATDVPIPPTDAPIPPPEQADAPQRPEHEGREGHEGPKGDMKMREGHHKGGKRFIAFFSIPAFVLALIFFIAGKKSECAVVAAYRSRGDNKTEEETVKVFSEAGTCRKFIVGFIVSFLFSIVGTALVLIFGRKYLRTRYGAFFGLAVHTIISGIFMSAHGAPFLLLAGLTFAQITSVHFKRAIASAVAKEGTSQC